MSDEAPRMVAYNGEHIYQAFMRARRSPGAKSSTPFKWTDGKTLWFNIVWDQETGTFSRATHDDVPLVPVQN